MTTTAKERIKTELQQVKEEGKQRATRIGSILKDAASMTFDEIKEGSLTLNVSARKSMAEILEELKETPEVSTDAAAEAEAIIADAAEVESDAAKAAPSWKIIAGHMLEIVRDRKGDWLKALQEYLAENAGKLDQNLTSKQGDRYLKFKQVFQGIINRFQTAQSKAKQANGADKNYSQPVNIEVVDSDTPTNSTTVRLIEPEA
ncbi:MAG: hypothetical protein WBA57_07080 [Elainellaceae cyanobacterium]